MNDDIYSDSYSSGRRLNAVDTKTFLGLRFINSEDDLFSERRLTSKPNFIIQGTDVLIDYSSIKNKLDLDEFQSIFRKKGTNKQFTIENANYSDSVQGIKANFSGTYTFKRFVGDDRILVTPVSGVSYDTERKIYKSNFFGTTPLIGITLPPNKTQSYKIVNELGVDSSESFANLGALIGDTLKLSGASAAANENRLYKITDIDIASDGTEIISVNRKLEEANFTGSPVIITLFKGRGSESKFKNCYYAKETIFDTNTQRYIETDQFVECEENYDFWARIRADRENYNLTNVEGPMDGSCDLCPERYQGSDELLTQQPEEPEVVPASILLTEEYRDYIQTLEKVKVPRSIRQVVKELFNIEYKNDSFTINNENKTNIEIFAGEYYRFDLSDPSLKNLGKRFAISKVRGGTNVGAGEFSSGVDRSGSLGDVGAYVAFRPPIDYRNYYWYIEGTDLGGEIVVKKIPNDVSITSPVIRTNDYSESIFEAYDMFLTREKAVKRSSVLGCPGIRTQKIHDQEYYLPCNSDSLYEYYLGLYNVKEKQATGPFSISGYYPLYNSPQSAVAASPTPTQARNEEERQLGFIGYHIHVLDGITYFMPNGLDVLGQQFHGNYVDDETYARSIPYDPEYITVSPEDIANGNYPTLRDPPDFPGGVNTCCTCDQRGCQTNCMECLFKAIQAVESGDWRNPFDEQQPLKQCDARASATAGGCGPFQIFPAYVEDARSVCRYGGGQSEPHCCDIPANAHELLCRDCSELPLLLRVECCQFKLKLSRLIVYCWYRRWTRNQKFRNCGLPDCTGSGHKSRQDGHTCYTCEDMAKMHKEGTCGHRCCQKPECCYQSPNEAEGGGPCARANQYWARVQSLMQTECPECLGPVISPTGTPSQKGCCCINNTTIDNLTKTDCDRLGGVHNPGAECETGPCDGCCCQVEYLPDGSIISYGETTRPEDCDDTPNNGKTFFPGQSCDDPRNPCGSEYGPDEPLLCCTPEENEFGNITSYTCTTSTLGQGCPAGTSSRILLEKCEDYDTPCAVGCCCFPEPGGFQKRYINRIACQHQGGLFSPGVSCKDTNCLFNDNPDVEEQVFVNKYTKVTDINEVVVDPGYSITEQTQTAITYVQQTPAPTPAPTAAPRRATVTPAPTSPPSPPSPPPSGSMGGYSY